MNILIQKSFWDTLPMLKFSAHSWMRVVHLWFLSRATGAYPPQVGSPNQYRSNLNAFVSPGHLFELQVLIQYAWAGPETQPCFSHGLPWGPCASSRDHTLRSEFKAGISLPGSNDSKSIPPVSRSVSIEFQSQLHHTGPWFLLKNCVAES